MTAIMMAIEGVLGDGPDFMTMQPNNQGKMLFACLSQENQIILVSSQPRLEQISHWVRLNGFMGYASIWSRPTEMCIPAKLGLPDLDVRMTQLRALRSSRIPVSILVDTDPDVVIGGTRLGITGLLFYSAHTASRRADLLPRPIRSWEDMADVEAPA